MMRSILVELAEQEKEAILSGFAFFVLALHGCLSESNVLPQEERYFEQISPCAAK